jgi:hypothetical protein
MERWSRNGFDPQKDTTIDWIKRHRLVEEATIMGGEISAYDQLLTDFKIASDKSKENVRRVFTEHMTTNFSVAGKICGMKYPDIHLGSMLLPVREANHISKSVAHDTSEENLERVCWTLYYSSSNIYKNIFAMEMSDYYEPMIMSNLKVSYVEAPGTSNKGCVALWSNKLLNRYRTSVQESISFNKECIIARINTNAPANVEKWVNEQGRPPTDKSCLYWIGTKNGTERLQGKNGKEEERLKIEWRWVRTHT